jgi:hypothetical protein
MDRLLRREPGERAGLTLISGGLMSTMVDILDDLRGVDELVSATTSPRTSIDDNVHIRL